MFYSSSVWQEPIILANTEASHDSLREIGQKLSTLVILHLSVLNWSTSQTVVQFHCLVSSNSSFIPCGLLTQPEVDVPLIAKLLSLGLCGEVIQLKASALIGYLQ